MAVDYGDVRTGVAFSDALGIMPGETLTLTERDAGTLAKRLAALAAQRGAGELVVGLPLNMNGGEGPRAEKTRAFAALLEKHAKLPLALWDERLTTVSAARLLHDAGRHGKQNRAKVDAAAAAVMLQEYLARKSAVAGDARRGGEPQP
ncbi:MAG: Holliday junction resolvase RuvX [Oscillospiraceae bacterium]|jgi:putative Holliday junction resolvase|nr:Holliday junction resolvase RuvX [Oscillospiraceae bacterium]